MTSLSETMKGRRNSFYVATIKLKEWTNATYARLPKHDELNLLSSKPDELNLLSSERVELTASGNSLSTYPEVLGDLTSGSTNLDVLGDDVPLSDRLKYLSLSGFSTAVPTPHAEEDNQVEHDDDATEEDVGLIGDKCST
jgi:hypothetical protein